MYLVWAGRCNGNASVFGPTRTAVVWAGALGTGFDSRKGRSPDFVSVWQAGVTVMGRTLAPLAQP